jgi:hypothetical protein
MNNYVYLLVANLGCKSTQHERGVEKSQLRFLRFVLGVTLRSKVRSETNLKQNTIHSFSGNDWNM